jgi:DNA-binding NarL/FixJ family response regulator
LQRARILLADDNDDIFGVAAQILEPEFEVVGTVGDGQSAIDEASKLDPDALVLDISMPVLNGIEVARLLQAAHSRAKVVFLTVHGDSEYIRAALGAGALGYVVKCRLASDLPLALREVLAGRSFVSPPLHSEVFS